MSTQPNYLTPEEYLEIERKSEVKSEYFRGEMFAMSGASVAHNRISRNLLRELGNQLDSSPCEVFGSDQRVLVQATGLYTYPDAVVVCGELKLVEKQFDTLVNPIVIVEITSPSTEAYDRGRKLDHYSSIETLCQYLIISSDRVHADLYTRQAGGAWLLTSVSARQDAVELPCIGCRLILGDLYKRVDPAALS